MKKKNILLIATGGTIASQRDIHGLTPKVSPETLIDAISGIHDFCNVEAVQVLNIDSTNIQPDHWLLIAKTIQERYESFDGFVVTHGTDTMAYTASALSYLIQSCPKPIVLTGSQRPIGAHGSDAQKNLFDSFRFCAMDGVSGVYLVFDGKAIIGTRARKVKSMSYSAFESINFPIAAHINERHIITYLLPSPEPGREVRFYDALNPNIFLLKLIPGVGPDVLEYVGQNRDAVIIESYGAGGLPFTDHNNFLATVKHLSQQGKIIVLTTQVMLEGSDLDVYEVGVRAMESAALLQTYDMTLESTVAKLMWILSGTKEFSQVKELFYTPVGHDLHLPR